MNFQLFFKRIMIISVVILMILCISGCEHKMNNQKENIYQVDFDTIIDEYISLSDIGNDFLIPKLSSQYWESYHYLKDETRFSKSKDDRAIFYIIRNTENINESEYTQTLNSNQLIKLVNRISEQYIGKIEESSQNVNYCNDIKYVDAIGRIGDKYCYCSYFQSISDIPSVSIQYVPTAYMIVYDDKEDISNIQNMIQEIKEWTIRRD